MPEQGGTKRTSVSSNSTSEWWIRSGKIIFMQTDGQVHKSGWVPQLIQMVHPDTTPPPKSRRHSKSKAGVPESEGSLVTYLFRAPRSTPKVYVGMSKNEVRDAAYMHRGQARINHQDSLPKDHRIFFTTKEVVVPTFKTTPVIVIKEESDSDPMPDVPRMCASPKRSPDDRPP
jgi:hypothetical protein